MQISLDSVLAELRDQLSELDGPSRLKTRGGSLPTTDGNISARDTERLAELRVLTGHSGSGKSTFLALARLAAESRGEIVISAGGLAPDSQALIELDDTVEAAGNVDKPAERWMKIWRVALLTSTVSTLRTNPDLAADISVSPTSDRKLIESDDSPLLRLASSQPVHPFRVLRELVRSPQRVDDPYWDDLEAALSRTIRGTRIHGFLDGLDYASDNAPALHYSSSAGLVAELIRHQTSPIGQVTRYATAVQQHVISHVPLQARRTAITEIHWHSEELVKCIGSAITSDDPIEDTIHSLLGIERIHNLDRGEAQEQIMPYILRHTFGVPRDLLSTLVCGLTARFTAEQQDRPFGSDDLRASLGPTAFGCGEAALYNFGTCLLAELGARSADRHLREVGRSVDDQLRLWLQALEDEASPWADLIETTEVAFGPDGARVLRSAFEQRLLGTYRPDTESKGRARLEFGGRRLDPQSAGYSIDYVGLSSCLIEVIECKKVSRLAPSVTFI